MFLDADVRHTPSHLDGQYYVYEHCGPHTEISHAVQVTHKVPSLNQILVNVLKITHNLWKVKRTTFTFVGWGGWSKRKSS